MSGDPTRALIRDLTADLTPVRPLPRVRFVAAVVLGAWLAPALLAVACKGLAPHFVALLPHLAGAGGVLVGLALAGLGGVLAALALAVPGRERLALVALALGGVGCALALAAAAACVGQAPAVAWRGPGGADLPCLALALAVGVVPGLALGAFAGRAATFHPIAAAAVAAAGAGALGGAAALATCNAGEPLHLVFGHALAPAVGAFALAVPLLAALRRAERGRMR